jgi:hypothetical protein
MPGLIDFGLRDEPVDEHMHVVAPRGVLRGALRHLTSRHGQLALVCPSERVIRPFKVTGLAGYLRIFRSREEALGGLATA